MPIVIKKTDRKDFTKLECPDCGERLKGVGLLKDSSSARNARPHGQLKPNKTKY